MIAIYNGLEDNVKFLLSKGAAMNLEDSKGDKAIDIAIKYNKPAIIEILKSNQSKKKLNNLKI